MGAAENKQVIQQAFDAWAAGEGGVFDLLAPDARWTIVGNSVAAGTYHSREELLRHTGCSSTSGPGEEHRHRGTQPGHVHCATSGMSSPCSRVQVRARRRASAIRCRSAAARGPSPETRSMTSMTSR